MKKLLALILPLFLLVPLSGCTEEPRPDPEALSARLSRMNENYAFEYFDMFLYEGAYQVYFSLCSEDDVLLSMHLEDDGSIKEVTVTARADSMKTDGEREACRSFTSAVISAFTLLEEEQLQEAKDAMSFDDTPLYFSDLYETFTISRYNLIFSSNSQFIFTRCQYFEEMTDFTP